MSTTALARPDEQKLEVGLVSLRDRANALVVCDADSYRLAAEGEVEVKNYVKNVGFELDPGIAKAKDTLDHLKNQKAKFVDPANQILAVFKDKRTAYAAEEKRKADEEQRREQEAKRVEQQRVAAEERRAAEAQAEADRKKRQKEIEEARKSGELRAAEARKLAKQAEEDATRQRELAKQQESQTAAAVPEVKVKPMIPTVQGVRNQTFWKFRVVDPTRIPLLYTKPDEVAIGEMVRRMKDKGKAEAACPGIEVSSVG